MSEAYEGVVFRSDEDAARRAFDSLHTVLRLRLIRLGEGIFGVQRIARRDEPFDPAAIEHIAVSISVSVGQTIALFYDNAQGIQVAVAFANGQRGVKYGQEDSRWVPLDLDGDPVKSGPLFRITELQPDVEYDCVYSAIDAALADIRAEISADSVKQAFCYDGGEILSDATSSR